MGNVFFENPTTLAGSEKEQLQALYRYLFAMSEKLNEAMNSITVENLEQGLQAKIRVIESGEQEVNQQKEVNALKALIVKTATIVRHEMDEIRTTLQDEYEAISEDFGEYERNLTNNITATAEGILQEYRFEERIQANSNAVADMAVHQVTNQYIYTGLVDPIKVRYGIAVGVDVTDEDGDLVTDNMCATFTMEEMAFYVNSVKVAWFSNQMFYIDRGEIVSSLKIGNHQWKAMADGSMVLVAV